MLFCPLVRTVSHCWNNDQKALIWLEWRLCQAHASNERVWIKRWLIKVLVTLFNCVHVICCPLVKLADLNRNHCLNNRQSLLIWLEWYTTILKHLLNAITISVFCTVDSVKSSTVTIGSCHHVNRMQADPSYQETDRQKLGLVAINDIWALFKCLAEWMTGMSTLIHKLCVRFTTRVIHISIGTMLIWILRKQVWKHVSRFKCHGRFIYLSICCDSSQRFREISGARKEFHSIFTQLAVECLITHIKEAFSFLHCF